MIKAECPNHRAHPFVVMMKCLILLPVYDSKGSMFLRSYIQVSKNEVFRTSQFV